jgi:hypothetical protein
MNYTVNQKMILIPDDKKALDVKRGELRGIFAAGVLDEF